MIEGQPTTVEDAVALFIHGARALHVGYYLDSRALEKKALRIIAEATRQIDARSLTGREPLMPFLDHKDEGVRTVAAAALYQSHSDRARSVLDHVERFGITEASGLAMRILMFNGRLNPCPSDPRYVGLYEDENGVDHTGAQAFRVRAFRGELPNHFPPKSRAESTRNKPFADGA